MQIRPSTIADLNVIRDIYARARLFMAEQGNPTQWGESWPPDELIRQDVAPADDAAGRSYVCEHEGRVVGVFFFAPGPDPTYVTIYDGAWRDASPYGVVHRIASDGTVRGVGAFCINWALEQCKHLRIDTHPDNAPMRNLLAKLGFEQCGIIYVVEDPYPRYAFEKSIQ